MVMTRDKLIDFMIARLDVYHLSNVYSLMCYERIPLQVANNSLYYMLDDLVEEFKMDNDLSDSWFEENFMDIDELFEEILDKSFDNY